MKYRNCIKKYRKTNIKTIYTSEEKNALENLPLNLGTKPSDIDKEEQSLTRHVRSQLFQLN